MDDAKSGRRTIFICYRRLIDGGYAGRLAEALEQKFEGNVFIDVGGDIQPGTSFGKEIDDTISKSAVVLVVISPGWLVLRRDGAPQRALDDARDHVRLEIAAGLRHAATVIPVLVSGAKMPEEAQLPADIAALAGIQAAELSATRWRYDVEQLARAITRVLARVDGAREPEPEPPPRRTRLWAVLLTIAAIAALATLFAMERLRSVDTATPPRRTQTAITTTAAEKPAPGGAPPSLPPNVVNTVLTSGVDLFDQTIDWQKVDPSAVEFAIIEATQGRSFKAADFDMTWSGLQEVDVTRGAYLVFMNEVDPVEQAAHYADVVKLEPLDLPPIVDFAAPRSAGAGAPADAATLSRNLAALLRELEARTGRRP
ncbi:MAG TPA: GH25 family lysozyme, partial [Thermoanaerobaculia bacterium]|nr:GH25 family lysozyme [Thermoanaerobaculia bacterium]